MVLVEMSKPRLRSLIQTQAVSDEVKISITAKDFIDYSITVGAVEAAG